MTSIRLVDVARRGILRAFIDINVHAKTRNFWNRDVPICQHQAHVNRALLLHVRCDHAIWTSYWSLRACLS